MRENRLVVIYLDFFLVLETDITVILLNVKKNKGKECFSIKI